ncbi:hypothetical protein NQ318_000796 [Aromia moschata]|uniref:DUF4817 domain-containing protein n=1 Tax=Aromia moschata TaxID=1265417 RepID=A0AAV8YUH8_9CUCU|nr:hypothetical protein NQ318_000796 [Aromia moschata]
MAIETINARRSPEGLGLDFSVAKQIHFHGQSTDDENAHANIGVLARQNVVALRRIPPIVGEMRVEKIIEVRCFVENVQFFASTPKEKTVLKIRLFVLQFREMVYLTEMHKITILQMIGYGDNTNAGRSTVSKIEKQFRERGHVRQLKKNPPNKLSDDQKLDVMFMLEENPHMSSRQTASALNMSHSSILRVLTENQMHLYKLVPTNELAEDDFYRRILFL